MDLADAKIATVSAPSTVAAQGLFRSVIAQYGRAMRIAGVVEEREAATQQGRTCRAGQLRSLTDNALYPMFQELGPGEAGCDLHGGNVGFASAMVRGDIAAGCDLVILSKFGKLEADGQGLADTFAAAADAGVPVLTRIPPAYEAAWFARIGARTVRLPAELEAIQDWLRAIGLPPPAI